MALRHKFIIFFVLATAHVIKAHDRNNPDPDFRPRKGSPLGSIQEKTREYTTEPTTSPQPVTWKPSASHHVFKFSNVGLQSIGRNFISSNDIIDLSLDNNNIRDISPFAFRNMRNLRHLNLSGNKIPKEKLLSLAGNIKLQTLIIDNNNDINNSPTAVLKEYEAFQSLEHLQLCNSQLQNIQIPFYLATPILNHLYLSNNSINFSNSVFDNIPASLTHLHLDRNLIDRIEREKLRHLRELSMDNNIITQVCYDECEEASISLRNAVRMQNLTLSRNLISEVTPDAFSDMNHLFNLDLSGNKIADMAKDTFNGSFQITSLSLADNILATVPNVCPMLYLRRLNLSGNRISTIFSNAFCFLTELEYLFLSNNVISSIETRAFQLRSLRYLDLSGNRLKQLPAQWAYPRNIQELYLERNNFTELDDLKLIDVGSLRNVYLDENPMPTLKAKSFKLLSEHLMVHLKNIHEDQCVQCQCDDDDDEADPNDEDSEESNDIYSS